MDVLAQPATETSELPAATRRSLRRLQMCLEGINERLEHFQERLDATRSELWALDEETRDALLLIEEVLGEDPP